MRRTVLPGGLRVVTEYVPSVRSASVGVWVNVGSRDEGPSVAGVAHFADAVDALVGVDAQDRVVVVGVDHRQSHVGDALAH